MEEFIQYFWYNQGFVYDSNINYVFSPYHLVMMGLMAVVLIVLWVIGNHMKNKTRLLTVVSFALLVLETLRVFNFHYAHEYSWFDSVSFHMCSIGVYLGIIAGIFKKKILFDLMFIQAFIGEITAIVIPLGILPWWNVFSFIPLQSNLSHMLMIFIVLYAVKSRIWEIKIKRYYIAVISFTVSAVGIHLLNLYKYSLNPTSYSNYFWTRFPDPQFPLINSLEFPYHLIIIIGIALFFGLLSYLIGSAFRKISEDKFN
jgi:uncharacterized membrane protein YwaF